MPIRVLIVDDSTVVRQAVRGVLDAEPDIEVVATASDGTMGLRRIDELHPDVVTLDVEMPGLDGLATLRVIRERWPSLPVIMYSGLTSRGAQATLEALALGAVDYATKPARLTSRDEVADSVRSQLVIRLRLWAGRDAARRPAAAPAAPAPAASAAAVVAPGGRTLRPQLIAIGLSTGGPDALAAVLPALPAHLPVPVVIVQHMPPVFTAMLAQRLDQRCAVGVHEAAGGETLMPGEVYIAPGGHHLEVVAGAGGAGTLGLRLNDDPPENSCRPAVDVLFRTATEATSGRLIAAVLTGMGSDGHLGARAVKAAGGLVVAQDEATSVVWGMPSFVARDGTASQVLPLDRIAPALVELCSAGVVTAGGPA